MSKFSLIDVDKKISHEVAHAQVMILLTYYSISVDVVENEQGKSAIISTLNKIEEYVQEGLVEITLKDGVLLVKQNLVKPCGEVTFLDYAELRGKHKMAMDAANQNQNYTKIYELVGSLTSVGSTGISQLIGKDISVVECLGTIFLAV